MKVFEIKTEGETDWVAADDFLSCLKFYLNENGIRVDDIDNIQELPDEKLNDMEIVYPDEDEEPNKTFKEVVEGLTEPEIIASTAYLDH